MTTKRTQMIACSCQNVRSRLLSGYIGLKYTKADVEALPLTRHEFHGEWNYTLTPPDTP